MIKIAVFASIAIAIKVLFAWSPIDILIGFGFWGSMYAVQKNNRAKKWLVIGICGITIVLSDYLFSVIHHREFLYPGIFLNELALWGAGLLPLVWKRLTYSATWNLIGISSSVLFFFILSNLSVFFVSPLYPLTFSGLFACYAAALPFLKIQWSSNLLGFVGLCLASHWMNAAKTANPFSNSKAV